MFSVQGSPVEMAWEVGDGRKVFLSFVGTQSLVSVFPKLVYLLLFLWYKTDLMAEPYGWQYQQGYSCENIIDVWVFPPSSYSELKLLFLKGWVNYWHSGYWHIWAVLLLWDRTVSHMIWYHWESFRNTEPRAYPGLRKETTSWGDLWK